MPKALPFFKFDADAWLTGKIQLLSAQEKGIFIDLVARIWKENGSLKNDEVLHRLLRVQKGTLNKSLEAFFQLGIMCEKDHVLSVKFVDSQLSQRFEYISKQSEIGKRGGRPKKGKKGKQKEESRKQIEDMEDTDDKSSVSSSPEPEKSGNPATNNDEKIFFDYNGDAKIHGITEQQLKLWKENFPAINVETELKSASAWLDANRKNRKTDVKRFLVNWLKRSQDRAPRVAEQQKGAGEGEWMV